MNKEVSARYVLSQFLKEVGTAYMQHNLVPRLPPARAAMKSTEGVSLVHAFTYDATALTHVDIVICSCRAVATVVLKHGTESYKS